MEVTKKKEQEAQGQEGKKAGIDPAIIEELMKGYQRPEDLTGPLQQRIDGSFAICYPFFGPERPWHNFSRVKPPKSNSMKSSVHPEIPSGEGGFSYYQFSSSMDPRKRKRRLPVLVSDDTAYVGLPKNDKGITPMFLVAGWARCLSGIIEYNGKVFFKLAAWRDYAGDNSTLSEVEERLRKEGAISEHSVNTSPFVKPRTNLN